MAGGRGGVGWAILAAALAVPGVLFYNWWSHLKTEHDRAVSQNARKRAEGVFEAAPAAGRLVNPISSAPAPTSPGAAAAPGVAVATAAALPVAAPPPAPPTAPTARAEPAPDAMSTAVSSMTTVVLPRDPMMSPLDLVRIQEAALEAEERRRRLEEERNRKNTPRRVVKPVLKPIETRIELQGIVAKPDGDNLAIVNGSTVNPGDRFTVEGYPGKVSILRISSSEVTMQYQGRKFRMSVNAD